MVPAAFVALGGIAQARTADAGVPGHIRGIRHRVRPRRRLHHADSPASPLLLRRRRRCSLLAGAPARRYAFLHALRRAHALQTDVAAHRVPRARRRCSSPWRLLHRAGLRCSLRNLLLLWPCYVFLEVVGHGRLEVHTCARNAACGAPASAWPPAKAVLVPADMAAGTRASGCWPAAAGRRELRRRARASRW